MLLKVAIKTVLMNRDDQYSSLYTCNHIHTAVLKHVPTLQPYLQQSSDMPLIPIERAKNGRDSLKRTRKPKASWPQ